jgi:hypothetical protein
MHPTASGDGLSCASTVEKATFVIQAKDVNGNNCTTGGTDFEVQALGRPDIKFEVMDKSDGTYSVAYGPTQQSEFQISVQLRDINIQGSPFEQVQFPHLKLSQGSCVFTDQLGLHMAVMLPTNRRALTLLGTCQDKSAFTPACFWGLVKGKGKHPRCHAKHSRIRFRRVRQRFIDV